MSKEVYKEGTGEIIEKKSRFITNLCHVKTEEDALFFIEKIKKKYWNATHNCFAFTIGENNELQRCSDDGEPSGTAGKPMLDVLLLEEVHNIAVVVTRYFGGTLLGTGGLVRAYTNATKEGLNQSVIIEKGLGIRFTMGVDYNGLGKIQYILGERNIKILDAIYTDEVNLKIICPIEIKEELLVAVTEATSGKAKIKEGEKVFFATHNSEVILF